MYEYQRRSTNLTNQDHRTQWRIYGMGEAWGTDSPIDFLSYVLNFAFLHLRTTNLIITPTALYSKITWTPP